MANWMGENPPDKWLDPHQRSAMYRESSAAPGGAHSAFSAPYNAFTGLTPEAQAKHDKMQYLLNKTLGPEHVANRPGGGGTKLSYLEGWRAINIANEVFGYNGWFTDIKYLEADFIDFNPETQRYNMGVTAIVRVRLQDGASHEDVGYGKLENTKSKADGLDKCKKEAVTDALKRALRHFGKLLGNCLYDKAYLQGLSNMKAPKAKFDFNGIWKPEQDNLPPNAPNAPWATASGDGGGGAGAEYKPFPPASTSASASMPPPHLPKPAAGAGAGKPTPAQTALNRAKTLPSSAVTGAAAAAARVPPQPKPAPAPPGGARALPPVPRQAATAAAAAAPAPAAAAGTGRPDPLDRSGATTEFGMSGEDESLLAGMDLDVHGAAGDVSTMTEGDSSMMANGTGLVYFEGDSGFAESEEIVALAKENSPSARPPANSRQPPIAPQNPNPPQQRPSPTEAKALAQARLAEKQQAAAARLAENQRKKAAQAQTAGQGQQNGVALGAAARPDGQPLRRSGSAEAAGGGAAGTATAAQLLRSNSTTGGGAGVGAAPVAIGVPALGNARPPGLRPAQPPSRANSLNGAKPPPKQAGTLPTLNVGAGLASRAATVGGIVNSGSGAAAREVLPAGGAQGVSGMVSASPPRAVEQPGGGFVSARGVKRGVGDGYDPSPPAGAGGLPSRPSNPVGSGGRRDPFGELEVDGETGAVKRVRA
ncbi:hypothetical protein JCM10213_006102 [Rhodosporidiobolus nylandii]